MTAALIVTTLSLLTMTIYLTWVGRTQGDQLNELVHAYHAMEDSLRNQLRQQSDSHRITVGDLKARIGETRAILDSTRTTVSRHHSDIAVLSQDVDQVMVFLADVPQNFAFNKTPGIDYRLVLPDRLKMDYSREG